MRSPDDGRRVSKKQADFQPLTATASLLNKRSRLQLTLTILNNYNYRIKQPLDNCSTVDRR